MKDFFKKLLSNPVFWLENKFIIKNAFTSVKIFRLFSYLLYPVILLLLMHFSPMFLNGYDILIKSMFSCPGWGEEIVFIICVQSSYFSLKSLLVSSSFITRDKEYKRYESIISMKIKPADILKGKFLAVFIPLFLELTTFYALFIFIGVNYNLVPFSIIVIYVSNVIYIAFFSIMGFYFSSISTKSGIALKKSMAWFVFIAVIFPVFAVLSQYFFPFKDVIIGMTELNEIVQMMISYISPVFNFIYLKYDSYYGSYKCFFDIPSTIVLIPSLVFYITVFWVLYKKTVENIDKVPER